MSAHPMDSRLFHGSATCSRTRYRDATPTCLRFNRVMPHSIPLNDLAASWLTSDEVLEVVERVVRSGWYVLGPENNAFEEALCEYVGVPFAAGVASGTDALALALQALGCGRGSLVAVVANAGGYAAVAAKSLGCDLLYIDIDADSHLMDRDDLATALAGHKVEAVVATHLYGSMAEITDIVELAHQHGAMVVEDCAQALGAVRDGRKAGSFGDAAAFSFYPTKNLGALGDGGAVASHDENVIERVKRSRQYGWATKYAIESEGGRNSRLDEIQAAVLSAGLKHLDAWNSKRRNILSQFAESLIRPARLVNCLGTDSTGHLAVVEAVSISQRQGWQDYLAALGIGSDIHYPIPDHKQIGLAPLHMRQLPNTDNLQGRVLSVPCYPGLTDSDVFRITTALGRLGEEGFQA